MDSNPAERDTLPALPADFGTPPGTAPSTAPGAGPGTETGTATGPAPVPAAGTETGTEISTVIPLTLAERASTALQYRYRAATVPGRPLHSLIHGKGDTLREHRARIKSHYWIPEGVTGRPESALAFLGVAHHVMIARPVKAAAKAARFTADKIDQAAESILLFYGLLFLFAALIVLLAVYL